jgi:hypothetical protein
MSTGLHITGLSAFRQRNSLQSLMSFKAYRTTVRDRTSRRRLAAERELQ